MITPGNIREVLDIIGPEIISESEKNKDYILIWLHVFNVGATVTAESKDYSEDLQQEAESNGQLFVDWDTFFRLYIDSGSENPHIKTLI